MKKILLYTAVSMFIVGFSYGSAYGNHTYASNLYPINAKVVSLDYTTDKVTVQQSNGTMWSFTGCDDWELNDNCNLIMNDNGTPEIYDDIIVDCKYSM